MFCCKKYFINHELCENVISAINLRYKEQQLRLDILVGFYIKSLQVIELYVIYNDGVADRVNKYLTIGSGGIIADYILSRLWFENLTVNQVIKTVIYVLEEAKRFDVGTGGLTDIFILDSQGIRKLDYSQVITEITNTFKVDLELKKSWLNECG